MKKYEVKSDKGTLEIEAYDLKEAIQKFEQLNSNVEIESVVKTSDY